MQATYSFSPAESDAQKAAAAPNIDSSDRSFLTEARSRWQFADEAEASARDEALKDLRFRVGEQWPDVLKADRDLDKRPCLVLNRVTQFIRQVTNEQRQNRPAIQVNPVGDGADVEDARIRQGLCRHIEIASDAEMHYDSAFEFAATCGMPGWVRVLTDYESPESFDQEIRIAGIQNHFSVYADPLSRTPDRSDMEWAFIVADLSIDTYRRKYKNSELASLDDFVSIGDRYPNWISRETVRVAEYYRIEHERRTLVKYYTADKPNGRTCFEDDLPEGARILRDAAGDPVTRDVEVPVVYWSLINAIEVLDERELPGDEIPLVPVTADEIEVDGTLYKQGIVRALRDPQRMYNYWASAEAETIALAPRSPFIAAEGQIEGHEQEWQAANTRNFSVLTYVPKSFGGQLAPPPQRNTFEPPIAAITQARMRAADDMKAVSGIYDDALGTGPNDRSGKAILARQKQTDTANFHYIDNLSRAIRRIGRIILAWIPKIYDTARVLRIVDPDQSIRQVPVNGAPLTNGVNRLYDLTTGKFDVTVSAGPSYQSKRQEAVESMTAFASAAPQLLPLYADLYVKNMDWPGAEEIAKRLVPPQIAAQQQQDKDGQPTPEAIQALKQQNAQLSEQLHAMTQLVLTKKLETDAKKEVALINSRGQILGQALRAGSTEAIEMLRQQVSAIQHAIDTKEAQDQAEAAAAASQAAPELQTTAL